MQDQEMEDKWSYSRIGFTIWGSTCGLGSLAVLLFMQRPSNGIGLLYLQYLVTHVMISALWVINDGVIQPKTTANTVVLWLINLLLLFAATVYFRIATVLLVGYRKKAYTYLFVAVWAGLVCFCIILTVVTYAADLVDSGSIVVYAWYCPSAMFALIVLYRQTCLLRTRGPPTPNTRLTSEYGEPFVSCVGRPYYILILGLIGGTIGMIDFQLPALEFLGVPIWESTFLGRIFDSIFYVPLMIPCLLWFDCPGNYKPGELPPRRGPSMTLDQDGTN